ncbi:MAG: hypothetical protein CENE_02328 [Candidatus Celerinatantimonas neptuna]|nr:MAG: hypothetical protein CENE_02328 [Candidatus Celerinatantimonas neptuna]
MKKYIVVVESSMLGIVFIKEAIEKMGYQPIFLINYISQGADSLLGL